MENEMLIITQKEIEQTLSLSDYIPIIETTHACHAHQQVYEPDLLHADVSEGEFHLKTGGLLYPDKQYYGVKINGGFPKNTERFNLPNILGVIYICDAQNGYPLAILDSVHISRLRTGAATAVAAKYLAPKENVRLGVFGYGAQAEIQIKALAKVCDIQEIRISGRNLTKAEAFVQKLQPEYSIPITSDSLENTTRKSNFLVTTTSAHQYYIKKEWVKPGTFIAAIGADSPGKQELAPELLASACVVADIKKQVCRVGESQHAIQQHLMTSDHIYAELGEIITGQKNCPPANQTIIYDSTGTALQDISVGIKIYEKLKQTNCNKICLFH